MKTNILNDVAGFLPANESHAIVETVFFIGFSSPFAETTLKRLMKAQYSLKDSLPRVDELHAMQFQFGGPISGQTIGTQHSRKAGVQLQSFKPDGSLAWMLRIGENNVSVHCLDYSRWETVWKKALIFFSAVFKESDIHNALATVGLKYLDRFDYVGEPNNFKLENLIESSSDLLAPKAFKSGLLWHSHIGWYDTVDTIEDPCLNQLNLDSGQRLESDQQRQFISIEHNALITFKSERKIEDFIDKKKSEKFSNIMQQLHLKNKSVLRKLLTDKIAMRINLNENAI